jgi:ABC-type antimicrobial peptide transport system permease subunit
MVVRQGLQMTGIGLAIGLPVAFAATRLLETLLYGVKPHDPVTFAGLVVLFAAVALLASYLPARKATRLNPNQALHFE